MIHFQHLKESNMKYILIGKPAAARPKLSYKGSCALWTYIQGVFFNWYPPKSISTKKLIWARLGVSRLIYINVDTPNLGFPYFNFLGGYQ